MHDYERMYARNRYRHAVSLQYLIGSSSGSGNGNGGSSSSSGNGGDGSVGGSGNGSVSGSSVADVVAVSVEGLRFSTLLSAAASPALTASTTLLSSKLISPSSSLSLLSSSSRPLLSYAVVNSSFIVDAITAADCVGARLRLPAAATATASTAAAASDFDDVTHFILRCDSGGTVVAGDDKVDTNGDDDNGGGGGGGSGSGGGSGCGGVSVDTEHGFVRGAVTQRRRLFAANVTNTATGVASTDHSDDETNGGSGGDGCVDTDFPAVVAAVSLGAVSVAVEPCTALVVAAFVTGDLLPALAYPTSSTSSSSLSSSASSSASSSSSSTSSSLPEKGSLRKSQTTTTKKLLMTATTASARERNATSIRFVVQRHAT
jgi:hypothetical protein